VTAVAPQCCLVTNPVVVETHLKRSFPGKMETERSAKRTKNNPSRPKAVASGRLDFMKLSLPSCSHDGRNDAG
jgi:hypothetical protein